MNKELSAIKYSKAVTGVCSGRGENTKHDGQSMSRLNASRRSCLLSCSYHRGVLQLPGGLNFSSHISAGTRPCLEMPSCLPLYNGVSGLLFLAEG